MKVLKIFFLTALSIFSIVDLIAQEFSVKVTKERVLQDFDGYGLKVILINNHKSDTINPGNYSKAISLVYKLNKDKKIKVLEEMMPYFDDYSLCGYRVKMYSPFAVLYGAKKHTNKKYSIAIESMYLINLMFYGEYARYLSNFQVLINKYDKNEVEFNDSLNISKMADLYRKWYKSKISIQKSNFSVLDLLDLYRGPIGWLDMEYMPDFGEIIPPLIGLVDLEQRRNEEEKREESMFRTIKPREDIQVIKPQFKVKK